jgi:hypothetical protein
MTTIKSLRPVLIGVGAACAVLAIGLSPTVHAVNAAYVLVTNTMANPVPVTSVDDRVAHPFGQRVFPNVRSFATLTVPAGKRLVIDSVSGFNNGNGSAMDLEVDIVSDGVGNAQRIPFGAPQSATALRYLSNENVRLVADPGSTVYFFIDDADFNDSAGINIDVHGYYVSAS